MTEPLSTVPAWSTYRKIRTIGAGAFGHVFLVESIAEKNTRVPPGQYVIKRMCLVSSEEVLRSAAVEIKILENLTPHENIVKYHEHFIDDEDCINIVIEHCPHGDLDKLIEQRAKINRPFSLCEVVYLTFQLLVGVRHLHASGIIHRDLKPSNIFVSGLSSGGDASSNIFPTTDSCRGLTLKIADFGISRVLERTGSLAKTVIGTPFYISPELCNGQPYSTSCDIWALGCVVFEIAATGQRCFSGDNVMSIVRCIVSGEVPNVPNRLDIDRFVRPLLLEMLQVEQKARPNADALLHRFFAPRRHNFADFFEDPDEDS